MQERIGIKGSVVNHIQKAFLGPHTFGNEQRNDVIHRIPFGNRYRNGRFLFGHGCEQGKQPVITHRSSDRPGAGNEIQGVLVSQAGINLEDRGMADDLLLIELLCHIVQCHIVAGQGHFGFHAFLVQGKSILHHINGKNADTHRYCQNKHQIYDRQGDGKDRAVFPPLHHLFPFLLRVFRRLILRLLILFYRGRNFGHGIAV